MGFTCYKCSDYKTICKGGKNLLILEAKGSKGGNHIKAAVQPSPYGRLVLELTSSLPVSCVHAIGSPKPCNSLIEKVVQAASVLTD